MINEDDTRLGISTFTHIRRNVLHFNPRQLFLNILHLAALNCPFKKIRMGLYRFRGSKIGDNVHFGPLVFLEEFAPELITIKDNTDIGARVTILTHDTILFHLNPPLPEMRTQKVVIGKNCYIGSGAIILPGVEIGDNVIIGAGSVVTRSIPPDCVAVGVPAKVLCSSQEWKRNHKIS